MQKTKASLGALLSALTLTLLISTTNAHAASNHALTMHGTPKYGPDFKHFDYVNPKAPKGGALVLAVVSGSGFDSLNPFIIKGVPAAGLSYLRENYLFDALAVHADDEPFTLYGLIAQTMKIAEDRASVTFTLRPEAKFQDGHPIQAQDVAFTFKLLTEQGHPLYSTYYQDVARVETQGDLQVTFHFKTNENRELPLILAEMPVLPEHYWQSREFNKSSLDIPLGSGPYRVDKIDPGRSIQYRRDPNYWAKDLAINRGRYNFETVRFDYYRDDSVALEALKAGDYDVRVENSAKNWATAYTGPQFERGDIIRAEIPNHNPAGMQGFVFNTRRPQFEDARVRQALAYAFDFEWTNQNIFYDAYTRSHSYFANSELASSGLPSAAELAILEPFRDQLPPEVFEQAYQSPSSNMPGGIRGNLRKAMNMLKEAGWQIKNNQLTHLASGRTMKFEILLVSPTFERVVLPYKKNLERLGIQTSVAIVDVQQYSHRINEFDFDMIISVIGQSNSPGNEQRDFWHSSEADRPGSRNYFGIKDPVVDALIEQLILASDRESLINQTRALDRVLLWSHYVIPQWHNKHFRVAYWNKVALPKVMPKYSLGFDSWWSRSAEAQPE